MASNATLGLVRVSTTHASSLTMPNQYFVRASVDPTNEYAVCTYYYDQAGQQPVGGS